MAETDVGLTVKKKDFSEWYQQLILKSEMADYSSVSGCIVLRPYSYAIWEKLQSFFDKKIKAIGVRNAYFPLLIPEKLLKKEADHVEGFSPEVAWVTHAGETKLNERLAIRPTSETIMYDSYSKWIRSYKDLPLLINQWCSVVRWEFKHAMPFLRTREFLWQEGHTVHANAKNAENESLQILDFYAELMEQMLCVPVIKGRKSEKEKFAGADHTYSVETFLPVGKAIQGATSHFLGQNFSKPFNITFLDKDEKQKLAWQNSWGVSTRVIGIMIIMHSDDKGLVLPPMVAPIPVVIVPIVFEKEKGKILKKCAEISKKIKCECVVDDRDDYTAGWKFNHWELKGVPVRIEVGPKDIAKKQVVLVRRDTGEKRAVAEKDVAKEVDKMLDSIQRNLFLNAQKMITENTRDADNWKEFEKAAADSKLIRAQWCENTKCEEEVKDATGAKVLTIPFEQPKKLGKCVKCGKKAKSVAFFAKSY